MDNQTSSLIGKVGQPIKKVNPFLKEFRDFAMRGNVIDLAVGVIIGAAFGKIVDALVTNVVMPPLSLLTGKINLSDRVLVLSKTEGIRFTDQKSADTAHAITVQYGVFFNQVIYFLIVSFSIFVCVRLINKIYRKPEAAPTKKDCPYCFSSIPIQATRCPQCTSMLDQPAAAAKP